MAIPDFENNAEKPTVLLREALLRSEAPKLNCVSVYIFRPFYACWAVVVTHAAQLWCFDLPNQECVIRCIRLNLVRFAVVVLLGAFPQPLTVGATVPWPGASSIQHLKKRTQNPREAQKNKHIFQPP